MARYSLLPADDPELHFVAWYGKMNMVAVPLAMALSYARNRDPKWALIHGFIGLPYLTYLGVKTVSQAEAELLIEAEHEFNDLAGQAEVA